MVTRHAWRRGRRQDLSFFFFAAEFFLPAFRVVRILRIPLDFGGFDRATTLGPGFVRDAAKLLVESEIKLGLPNALLVCIRAQFGSDETARGQLQPGGF